MVLRRCSDTLSDHQISRDRISLVLFRSGNVKNAIPTREEYLQKHCPSIFQAFSKHGCAADVGDACNGSAQMPMPKVIFPGKKSPRSPLGTLTSRVQW
jgi:hypothetical protein